MRAYTFTENGYTFKRINKKQARQAYSNGLTVRFCPCNLRPGSPFRLDMDINKINQNCAGETFDSIVNAFEWYNCRDSDYNGTITAIKAAVKEMRDELRTIPTWTQYNRAC